MSSPVLQWVLGVWRGDVAALVAGLLLPLAYAPVAVSPLAVLAPAMLFLLWLHSTPKRAAWRGFLFGLGMFGVGVSWVFVSIYFYGQVNLVLSIFLTTLFVVVLALFPALLGYVLTRFFRVPGPQGQRLKLLVAWPAAWVLFEWLRGIFFSGFPWLHLGYSQIDSPLRGYAPLLGVYGVSWAVALSAGLLLMILRAGEGRRRAIYGGGLLGIWLIGALLTGVQWTQVHGRPLSVALIQGNIEQDMKWQPEVRMSTIELYTDLTREHWGRDLIVWPETALPAFYEEAQDYLAVMAEEARSHQTDMLVGLLYEDPVTRQYYNSMVSVGRQQAFYHKNHLVPFTEYLPLKGLLGGIVDFMQVPMSDFSAGGAKQQPLAVAGQYAGISICFEDAFGEEVRQALPKATLLVNVTNDAWFTGTIAPAQHLQMARMRAQETGRPLLRATNTGLTALIDAQGRLLSVAPSDLVYVLTGEVQPMQGMTLYAMTGNGLILSLMVVMLGLAWWLGRKIPLSTPI